ncbi:MAG: hypothetical protein HND53_10920 [Proteobacteria bacterium]|nr:hypothetical protein [Pseudomonadota bacterium]NOG61004.1 hypothetical protein [Pseudomonadota bacterium]
MKGTIAFLAGLACGALIMCVTWGATYYFYKPELVLDIYGGDQRLIDSMNVAGQLGRLDFISLLLAIVAALLVFAALPVYRVILKRCEDTVVSNWQKLESDVHDNVEKLVIEDLEEKLPEFVDSYMELAKNASENDPIADQIMQAQDDND